MARTSLKNIVRFLRHAPPENPAMREINAAAKRVKDAMHVRGNSVGGVVTSFHSGGRMADKLFGQELASGHEKARKKAPPPKGR